MTNHLRHIQRQKEVKIEPIVWPRADPEALAKFDPRTKECTMNCGKHADDPRSAAECKFLCEDCVPATPRKQYVDMPQNVEQAQLMVLLGMNYLEQHAPHLLKKDKDA